MKTRSSTRPGIAGIFKLILALLIAILAVSYSHAQAVTEVISDFGGYWKTSATSVSAVKPNNSHNLLAFSYNGTRYSTGVNNALLSAHGDAFTGGNFWALPVISLTGAITANTKVGFGAMYDGVANGPGIPAPASGIETYLTDGIKGLGLGSCVANLPVGNLSFTITNIQPSAIGDGVPDILITQVADPTANSYDRYSFTDLLGNRVGNYRDVIFNATAPVGNWTADFYEARVNPLTLSSGFTQTDRPIRLWAADFSDFGITAANYQLIKTFAIALSGNSDIAFVAYNQQSADLLQVLPVTYNFFTASKQGSAVTLNWQTASEKDAAFYYVERSNDGITYGTIGIVAAKNAALCQYSFSDAAPAKGTNYYRLKQMDVSGNGNYSKVVRTTFERGDVQTLAVYPNPATETIVAAHGLAAGNETLAIYNTAGIVVKQVAVQPNTVQTKIALPALPKGTYFISYKKLTLLSTTSFLVN